MVSKDTMFSFCYLLRFASKMLKVSIVLYSRDTYIERQPGETANDRNDRAIRTAALWYKKHLALSQEPDNPDAVQVVLLTNDRENANKAKDLGITTFTGKRKNKRFVSAKAERPYRHVT